MVDTGELVVKSQRRTNMYVFLQDVLENRRVEGDAPQGGGHLGVTYGFILCVGVAGPAKCLLYMAGEVSSRRLEHVQRNVCTEHPTRPPSSYQTASKFRAPYWQPRFQLVHHMTLSLHQTLLCIGLRNLAPRQMYNVPSRHA